MPETTSSEHARRLRNDLTQSLATIDGNKDLHPQVRRALKAREVLSVRQQLPVLRNEHHAEIAELRRELEHKVFGHPADPAEYRHALEIASRIDDAKTAAEAYRRSQRTGDELMQRALLTRAVERGFRDVRAMYREDHPSDVEAIDALEALEAGTKDASHRFAASATFTPPRFSDLPDDDRALAALARGADAGITASS